MREQEQPTEIPDKGHHAIYIMDLGAQCFYGLDPFTKTIETL